MKYHLHITFTGVNQASREFLGQSEDWGLMIGEWDRWAAFLNSPYITTYHMVLKEDSKIIRQESHPYSQN